MAVEHLLIDSVIIISLYAYYVLGYLVDTGNIVVNKSGVDCALLDQWGNSKVVSACLEGNEQSVGTENVVARLGEGVERVARKYHLAGVIKLKLFRTEFTSWTAAFSVGSSITVDVPANDLSLSLGLTSLNNTAWSSISFSFVTAFSFYLCFLRQVFHFTDRCCVIV